MFQRNITRAIFTTLTLSGVALMMGACGDLSRQALAPDLAATSTQPSKALPRAAKSAASEYHSEGDGNHFANGQGGELNVTFPVYGNDNYVRVEKVKFHVNQKSTHNDTNITMTAISGATVNDVKIIFGPDGFVFDQPASLTITLKGSVNPSGLKVYHISSNGAVSQASFQVSSLGKNHTEITIQVPGFSCYSLGDNGWGIMTIGGALIPQALGF